MKKQEKSRRVKATSKKDYFTIISIFSCMIFLIFRIPLSYIIGNKGISYFASANELYLTITGIVAYGLSEAVSSLVRYRVKREQYKNADKVLQGALLFGAAAGIIIGLGMGFSGYFLASKVMGTPLAGMAVSLIAPAIPFTILTGVFKGYFQGNGSRVPTVHSKILEMIFMVSGGLIGSVFLYRYGEKVSALLQNGDYAGAYGAMGAALGILGASVLCFVHMLVLYLLYRSGSRHQEIREQQRNQDTGFHIIHMLIGTGLPFAFFAFLYNGKTLLNQLLFNRLSAPSTDVVSLWGNYYGRYLVIIGLLSTVILLFGVEPVRRITFLFEREEYRNARERLSVLIHQTALGAIPTAVFTAVLAENILDLFFKGNNGVTAQWLMAGSVIIILNVYAVVFARLLIKCRKMKYVIAYCFLAMVLHIGCIFLTVSKLGITGLIIGNIVFSLTAAGLGFFLLCRLFQYRQEWLKCFAVTLITAAIAGLLAMLLNKVVLPRLGSVISLAVCLPAAVIIFIVLLILARGVTEKELEMMTGGKLLIGLGRLMHLM